MYRLFTAMAILLGSAQSHAYAWPLPNGQMSIMSIPESFTANYNFEGIVALNNCSGSIVQYENALDSDLAMVLTNGHCLETGFPKPNTYVAGKASKRRFKVFDKNAKAIDIILAKEIIYSTMTGTDMTLYKLNITVGQVKQKYGFAPLVLSSTKPQLNQPIEIISGYWERGYRCNIEAFAEELREDNWTQHDSIRYSRPGCEIIGGTSGSPIIAASTRTVVGVNNTGNMDGLKCSENNPCEVNKDGSLTYKKGYNYGQQTYWIYSCLNANKELDLKTAGCLLYH